MDSSPNLYEPSINVSSPIGSHLSLRQSLSNSNKVNSLQAKQRDLSGLRAGDLSAAVAELAADLNTPEISFDLQQFISSEIAASAAAAAAGHPQNSLPVLEDSVSLFNDLLEAKQQQRQTQQQVPQSNSGSNNHNSSFGTFSMPQQSRLGTDRYGAEATQLNTTSVKREPLDGDKIDFSSCPQSQGYSPSTAYASFSPERSSLGHRALSESQTGPLSLVHFGSANSGGHLSGRSSSVSSHSVSGGVKGLKKKHADKGTDEYKKRRERNNIAVRKSREKAKMRSRETEKRVSELQRDNENLRKRVDLLGNQLNVLKALLVNVGVPSESVESEIARSLQMEGHL